MAKALSPEDMAALDKELAAADPRFNAERSRIIAHNVQVEAAKVTEQIRLDREHGDEMDRRAAYFATPEGQQAVLTNPQAAAAHAEALAYQQDKSVAPTRARLEQGIRQGLGNEAVANLKALWADNPERKPLLDRWDSLTKVTGEGPQLVAEFFDKVTAAIARDVEAKYAAKLDARVADQVAEQILGTPEATLVTAGVASTNGYRSLDDAVAAHIRGEITNDEMRALNRRFGRTN